MIKRGGIASQRGLVVWLKVVSFGGFVLVIVVTYLYFAPGGGGRPLQITLSPNPVSLMPGTPRTVTMRMALSGPLAPGMIVTHNVRIDEDDPTYDDTLFSKVTVVRGMGQPDARGTFRVECKNLKANGKFDLHASPSGGSSKDEIFHQIHGEYSRWRANIISANVTVSCSSTPGS